MSIIELHHQFRRHCLLELNLSPTTVRSMESYIKTFLRRTSAESVRDIGLDLLREFFYEGKEKYLWSYSHLVNHHKYLKKFLGWCVQKQYISTNPIFEIKKPKKPKSLPRRLNDGEPERIFLATLHHPWRYHFEMQRNYAIIGTLLYSGLRARELLGLRIREVNLNSGNILVINGKDSKDRNIPIHYKLKRILHTYFLERNRIGRKSEYLFTGVQSDKPLSYKDLSSICRKISKEADIKFTPHQLRHTLGSVSVEQGLELPKLQAILGHSDISSTMIYLKMSSKNVKESLNKLELY